MPELELHLPWPPSVNHYWRTARGRHYVSPEGVAFRKAVAGAVGSMEPLTGRLRVDVELTAPDRRRYDVDNRMKGLLDSLTHAGAWLDDWQVDVLHIERMPPAKGNGGCVVRIREI